MDLDLIRPWTGPFLSSSTLEDVTSILRYINVSILFYSILNITTAAHTPITTNSIDTNRKSNNITANTLNITTNIVNFYAIILILIVLRSR